MKIKFKKRLYYDDMIWLERNYKRYDKMFVSADRLWLKNDKENSTVFYVKTIGETDQTIKPIDIDFIRKLVPRDAYES